jgi:hypothetical protein
VPRLRLRGARARCRSAAPCEAPRRRKGSAWSGCASAFMSLFCSRVDRGPEALRVMPEGTRV